MSQDKMFLKNVPNYRREYYSIQKLSFPISFINFKNDILPKFPNEINQKMNYRI